MKYKSSRIGKWIAGALVITIIVSLITIMSGIYIADVKYNSRYFFSMIGISFLMASIICICGYLRLNMLFYLLITGLITGILMMIYVYSYGEGWKDLIGPLDLVFFYIGGLVVGGILEFIRFLYKAYSKKK